MIIFVSITLASGIPIRYCPWNLALEITPRCGAFLHDKTVGAGFAVLLILSLDSGMRLMTNASAYVRGHKPSKVIVIREERSYVEH